MGGTHPPCAAPPYTGQNAGVTPSTQVVERSCEPLTCPAAHGAPQARNPQSPHTWRLPSLCCLTPCALHCPSHACRVTHAVCPSRTPCVPPPHPQRRGSSPAPPCPKCSHCTHEAVLDPLTGGGGLPASLSRGGVRPRVPACGVPPPCGPHAARLPKPHHVVCNSPHGPRPSAAACG